MDGSRLRIFGYSAKLYRNSGFVAPEVTGWVFQSENSV